MTSPIHPIAARPRTRRALLVGALGGIGAWAASAVGRASPARAEGETIVVGGEYTTATTLTSITNNANLNHVFQASSASSGIGVIGTSANNVGIYGNSTQGIGLWGDSNVSGQPAVIGRAAGNATGVLGFSGYGNGGVPPVKANTGVYGLAEQGTGSKGVWGNSPKGHGIHGQSADGWAGFFDGKVFTNRYIELVEMATPRVPNSNRARLFLRDRNGQTQLCVRFHNGTVRVLAAS